MEKDKRIKQLAQAVLKNSVKIQPGEKIMIEAIGLGAKEALDEFVSQATKMGAVPYYFLHDDNTLKEFISNANKEQMSEYASMQAGIMAEVDAYVALRAYDDIYAMSDVSPKQMKIYNEYYYKPVHWGIRIPQTRWCVMRYPTDTLAAIAKMSKKAFEDYFFGATLMNYKKMEKAMDGLYKLMDKTDKVRIKTSDTDLTFSIKGIPVRKSFGEHNMPDGEVFTAPVRESINGHIQFNTKTTYDGDAYSHIYLEFENGKIVKAKSEVNDKKFQHLLDVDKGARYIGEFALGFNPYITHEIGEIAFDEKIAGSLHIAIGNSYEDVPNGNHSSIHWDLVQIHTKEYGGGEIYFDDVLIRKDGVFVLKELECLNPDKLK